MIDILIFSIKPFFIFCNSLLVYRKLCRIKTTKKDLLDFPISLIFAIIVGFASSFSSGLVIPVTYVLLFSYLLLKYKLNFFMGLTITCISLAIVYCLVEVALIVTLPISLLAYNLLSNVGIRTVIMLLVVGICHLLLGSLVLKNKKLKNSLYPNFHNNSYQILTFISLVLIVVSSLFNSQFYQNKLFILTMFFSLIICLLLLFFWFKHINETYKNHVVNRNTEILENSVVELEKENKALKGENVKFAEIIHRDNKIIPALITAVDAALEKEYSDTLADLRNHLIELNEERNDLIDDYKENYTSLAKTGNLSIDGAIKLLNTKSLKEDDTFLFHTDGDVGQLCDKMALTDLVGLICDLGENAIISTRESESKKICVSIVASEESSYLEFYDSGEEFSAKALEFFGKRRYTTHKNEGGSGIGLMSIYALMEKYKFSFELTENNVVPYNKAIKIKFDNRKQIIINSKRQEIINLAKEREDFILINE